MSQERLQGRLELFARLRANEAASHASRTVDHQRDRKTEHAKMIARPSLVGHQEGVRHPVGPREVLHVTRPARIDRDTDHPHISRSKLSGKNH